MAKPVLPLLVIALGATLASIGCAVSIFPWQKTWYEYQVDGKSYALSLKNGKIVDTSLVLDASMHELESIQWSWDDTKSAKSLYLSTRLDTTVGDSTETRPTQAILDSIRAKTPGLRHVYNRHLRKRPGFKGTVTLKFWIDSEGHIDRIYIIKDTTYHKSFAIEVLKDVAKWNFSKAISRDKLDIVTVPFTFSE